MQDLVGGLLQAMKYFFSEKKWGIIYFIIII